MNMESLAVILPIIAGGSIVFVTGLSLYFKIRHKFPIRVNCWFCNQNTDVPYGNRNCWDCPHCEQYNGFLPDGSYNKAIPAQHDELLNHPVHAVSNTVLGKKSTTLETNGNGLCRKCNINQELKVQQLAGFTPVNPAHYDEEVDEFRRHLERAYRLCSPCEDVLKQTLYKQKSMLLGFRLTQLRNSKYGKDLLVLLKARFFHLLSSWDYLVLYFTTVLSAWLVLGAAVHLNKGELPFPTIVTNSTVWSFVPYKKEFSPLLPKLLPVALKYDIPLTAVGIMVQLAAVVPKGHERIRKVCVSFWVLLHILSWLRRWKKLEKYVSLLDFSIAHVTVTFMTLFLCTYNALLPRRRFTPVKSQTKKIRILNSSSESSFNTSSISDVSTTTPSPSYNQNEDTDSPLKFSRKEETRPTSPSKTGVCDFKPVNTSPLHRATVSPCSVQSSLPVTSAYEDDNSEDLGRGLGNLNLGSSSYDRWSNRKIMNSNNSSFERKVYGQNSCSELFDRSADIRNRRRSIIRPSQFNLHKNITHSSWVAGGYWQSPVRNRVLPVPGIEAQEILPSMNTFAPLSRSSSQSSGFVSQSSQPGVYDGGATSLPNSRTGSICGAEFDRFSALSEPIYPYATTPIYYTGARPGTFMGAHYYGGPPIFMQPAYGVVSQPTGFLSNYGTPQPIINQTQCYYPSPNRPLGAIWNPSAFSPVPRKQPQNDELPPAADVLSRSSSQNSNDSHDSLNKTAVGNATKRDCVPSPGRRTFISVVQENLFLAVLFFSSLLFNAFVLGFVMLGNSNMMLPGAL
ncbi:uncharacterized protein [Periplaneta americana]|uniref:uncharacterized protein n=1 Tax=Periplaneta americana TaxID=6978 RepID=UPI0037E989BB